MSAFLTDYQLNFWERILQPAFIATIQMVVITTSRDDSGLSNCSYFVSK